MVGHLSFCLSVVLLPALFSGLSCVFACLLAFLLFVFPAAVLVSVLRFRFAFMMLCLDLQLDG